MRQVGKIPDNMRVSLKTARELNGLKQSEAAKLIGVSTDTLGNYERGKKLSRPSDITENRRSIRYSL